MRIIKGVMGFNLDNEIASLLRFIKKYKSTNVGQIALEQARQFNSGSVV